MKQVHNDGRFCVCLLPYWYTALCASFEDGETELLTKILTEVKELAEWILEHEEKVSEGSITVFGSVASKIGAHVVKLHFYVEDKKNRGFLYTKQARAQALFSLRRLIIDCCLGNHLSENTEVTQLAW